MTRLLTLTLAAALFVAPAHAQSLNDALSAYRSNRVAEAEPMFAAIAADVAAPVADRAAALIELARIDWLARGETDAATTLLAGVPSGPDRCRAAALAARIFRDSGDPAAALPAAAAGRDQCTEASDENLRIQLARAHMALAVGASQSAHLAAAAQELAGVSAVAANRPAVAATRLSLALMQRDAAAALDAWRAYFWLDGAADAPPAFTTFAGRVQMMFAAALAPDAADGDVLALVTLLIRAGFTDDARLLAAQSGIGARLGHDNAWRRAAAFMTFHAALQHAALSANRDMINGGRGARFADDVRAATAQVMRDADLSGDPRAALLDAFGLYGTVGETSGYPSMHAGHLVADEHMRVAQYGRQGEVRFVVIDNMLGNGFESWLWDGWAQAGGWAPSDDTIVQVRSAYTDGPLASLRRVRPGPQRTQFIEAITRADADERAALGRDGVATLPATSDRLELQVLDQIAERVGADDDAFLAEIWRATVQYSITAHEGRHVLDKADGDYSSDALEFRAKLSQIIFADYPRLALSSVAGQAINATPHGQGNRRVLEGYRRWMRAHRSEIAGFDRRQPTLSQLHLLTDAQIVAAARSMDPWAR